MQIVWIHKLIHIRRRFYGCHKTLWISTPFKTWHWRAHFTLPDLILPPSDSSGKKRVVLKLFRKEELEHPQCSPLDSFQAPGYESSSNFCLGSIKRSKTYRHVDLEAHLMKFKGSYIMGHHQGWGQVTLHGSPFIF